MLLAPQPVLSKVVEKGDKSVWRPGQDMCPYLHLIQDKSSRVKLMKKYDIFIFGS